MSESGDGEKDHGETEDESETDDDDEKEKENKKNNHAVTIVIPKQASMECLPNLPPNMMTIMSPEKQQLAPPSRLTARIRPDDIIIFEI